MTVKPISIHPLKDDLAFGARIAGVTQAALGDPAVRGQIKATFEQKGLIIFEDVEPTSRMHVALSNVFGPLKDHPSKAVPRVDQDAMPGVIEMKSNAGEAPIVEIDGRPLASWLPWHFDHCYNNELNRAGVLRATEVAPEGGLTGFVDGIDLYRALSSDLRAWIEGKDIIYTMNVIMGAMRFGRPRNLVEPMIKPVLKAVMDAAKGVPRALHPAVWTRSSGEKVLHVSPWMAEGVAGHEDPAGDAMFERVCQEINAKARPYWHHWNLSDMLIWDNWRMLHSVSGMDPQYSRCMRRTTIAGDYGLGRFEDDSSSSKPVLEMTF
jgi:taurine dioxygenase